MTQSRGINQATLALGVFIAASWGCSGTPSSNTCASNGVGGYVGTDPCAATGGVSTGGMMGTGGTKATGGSASTGGVVPTGGTMATGGGQATGGAVAMGGAMAAGGNPATGGAIPTGGASPTGGTMATGGIANTGGMATGGAVPTGGSKSTGGAPATGGSKPTGGSTSTGGAVTTGGSKPTGGAPPTGGSANTGGAGTGGAAATFVCNQVLGPNVASQWFLAGFENIVNDPRWQAKFQHEAYVDQWANPSSTFWNAPIASSCAQNSSSPDRIVFTVLSWNVWTQQQWETEITTALNTVRSKYPNVKRIDLMTPVRSPGNRACAPPVAGQSAQMPAALDAAIVAVAGRSPGSVFVSPKFEAPDCTVFIGAGPDMTASGSATMAKIVGGYFVNLQ